jgi:hypothetical protein
LTAPTAVPAAAPDPAAAPAAPQRAATDPPQPSATRPTKPRATPNRTPQAGSEDPSQAVARAFVQQKARVARCLSDHADVVPTTTDLDVRIALEASGKVREVQVTPDAIASSPAGACIVAAVQAMTFDAQPAPLTVHVPISARRK